MKKEVREAIDKGIVVRRNVLSDLSHSQKISLLELLFKDFFHDQHHMLQKWGALTGQTAQVDTGYISQFIASIVTGIPGQGFRGKGDDLVDGGEVKSAANISGVDRPRWNHNLGTLADDEKKRKKGDLTVGEKYLASPYLFYVLVDRAKADQNTRIQPIRVRAWCVNAQEDDAWRSLVENFLESRTASKYNLQLHPPVGFDDNVVVNELGNLDFKDLLIFDYRMVPQRDGSFLGSWHVALPDSIFPLDKRSIAKPYGGRGARRSNYTAAGDLVADVAILPDYFPGIISKREEDKLDAVIDQEINAESDN